MNIYFLINNQHKRNYKVSSPVRAFKNNFDVNGAYKYLFSYQEFSYNGEQKSEPYRSSFSKDILTTDKDIKVEDNFILLCKVDKTKNERIIIPTIIFSSREEFIDYVNASIMDKDSQLPINISHDELFLKLDSRNFQMYTFKLEEKRKF